MIWHLMYYVGFTYTEAYQLPITYRRYFMAKLIETVEASKETKATHDNAPETRALSGKLRTDGPARTRRFT